MAGGWKWSGRPWPAGGELKPADRVTLIGFSDDAELLVDDLRLEALGADGRPAGEVDSLAAVEHFASRRRHQRRGGRRAGDQCHPACPGRADASTSIGPTFGRIGRSGPEHWRSDRRPCCGRFRKGRKVRRDRRQWRARFLGPWPNWPKPAVAAAGRLPIPTKSPRPFLIHSPAWHRPWPVSRPLKVTFNPQAVRAYRLVGHATATITGPASASTQVDLHADARAAGLFEFWLQPGGGDDVATAEFSWRDPSGTDTQQLNQRISRLQFAKSFAESPLPLQASAIAAEAARALDHSPPAFGTSLGVLELAGQVHPQLQASDSFRDLVALVSRAEKLRASGAGTRRPAASAKPDAGSQR